MSIHMFILQKHAVSLLIIVSKIKRGTSISNLLNRKVTVFSNYNTLLVFRVLQKLKVATQF